jgi:hypothetical protein
MRAPRVAALALSCLAAIGATACSSSPTTPGSTGGTIDLSGTWTQSGATRTWVMTETVVSGLGIAGGKTTYTVSRTYFGGTVSGTGSVQGDLFGNQFIFEEDDDGVPGLPVSMDCSVTIEGTLAVNGGSLTGGYTEYDDCNGVRLATLTGTITMQKK